jgi:uncharacterized membrane protein (DUF106 family)
VDSVAFNTLLDPVLNPLLTLGPFFAILIISIIVSLFTTIIYKYATDQNKLRKLKADLKRYQKKAKDAQKDNPEKAMKIQKDMMKINGQYMKASFKSTLYTFIPVLIFFGWLGAHLAFAPLMPLDPFSISAELQPNVQGTFILDIPENFSSSTLNLSSQNNSIVWENISGPEGTYDFSITHVESDEQHFFSIMISPYDYVNPINVISESLVFESITVHHKKLVVFKNIFFFKDLPWIKNWGWLGSYILFSIIFSTALRKGMKLA